MVLLKCLICSNVIGRNSKEATLLHVLIKHLGWKQVIFWEKRKGCESGEKKLT